MIMKYIFLRFPGGKPKAVTFSYDDGCRSDIRFVETIDKYGIKCTFNINSEMFGADENSSRLTADEVEKYLASSHHEIAVHGAFHKAEGSIRPIMGIRDVLDCRRGLEKRFDRIITGMAYPDSGITVFRNGADYETIKRYLKDLGISYARTLGGDNASFELPADWYAWMPTAHHSNPNVMNYITKFCNIKYDNVYVANRAPRLFYLWGHSYEFKNNNNWELLDNICEALGGKDDTWYATNMEIYEYVEAYKSLVFSADDSICYNPTLKDIWFDIGEKLVMIKSGETIRL